MSQTIFVGGVPYADREAALDTADIRAREDTRRQVVAHEYVELAWRIRPSALPNQRSRLRAVQFSIIACSVIAQKGAD